MLLRFIQKKNGYNPPGSTAGIPQTTPAGTYPGILEGLQRAITGEIPAGTTSGIVARTPGEFLVGMFANTLRDIPAGMLEKSLKEL